MRGVATFVLLLSCSVRQFEISVHAFLCMTFHFIGLRGNVCAKLLETRKLFGCSCRNSGFKHGSVIVHNIFAQITLSLSASQVYMIKE